jgi:hypothetical protein
MCQEVMYFNIASYHYSNIINVSTVKVTSQSASPNLDVLIKAYEDNGYSVSKITSIECAIHSPVKYEYMTPLIIAQKDNLYIRIHMLHTWDFN